MDTIVSPSHGPRKFTDRDVALIFSRLIIDGLIAGDLLPERACKLGTHAGHHGLRALYYAQSAEPTPLSAYQDTTALGLRLIRSGFDKSVWGAS